MTDQDEEWLQRLAEAGDRHGTPVRLLPAGIPWKWLLILAGILYYLEQA